MMDNSPLLVPMDVYALAVVHESQNYQRWQMNYSQARFFKAAEPAPPYTGSSDLSADPATRGVYLLWTLPWALRHGWQKSQDSGQIDFPLVPNRWLIVRYSGPASGRTATAWIVESDFLDPVKGSSPYAINATAGLPQSTRIGRAVPLGSWQETASGPLFLQATAPANELFASYQPANENVFSFHDNLVIQGNLKDTLSYFVAGWYSNAAADILYDWRANQRGKNYSDLLARLRWTLDDTTSRTARTTLYHGMVRDVVWDDGGSIPTSARNQISTIRVAVGNSAVDALAALIQARSTSAQGLSASDAQLLQAFQYNLLDLLDQPGGTEVLDEQIRAAWFGSTFGGTIWKAVDVERAPGTAAPLALTPTQARVEAEMLADLNQAQATLDQQQFLLQSLRRQLYEIWWKAGYSSQRADPPAGTTPADFQQALDPNNTSGMLEPSRADPHHLAAQVKAQASIVTAQRMVVAEKVQAVRASMAASRQLKATNAPPFWMANDPVVVLAGACPDASLELDPSKLLLTRYTDQVVTGLTVNSSSGPRTITTASPGLSKVLPALDLSGVPQSAAIAALLSEFFFLDPYNAPGLAQSVLGTDAPELVDALVKAMTGGAGAITSGKLSGLNLNAWAQPWLPLYFEWAVNWYPIPFAIGDTPHWSFDGTEYHWDGTLASLPQPRQIAGRSFLTPKLASTFSSRLRQFLKYRPDEADLQSLLESVAHWDFLSQALTGFTTQTALRDSLSNLTPDTELAGLVEREYETVPQSLDYNYDGPLPPPPTYSTFEGLRGGQFYFTRLTVIDHFGQTVEVVNDQNSAIFAPVPASDLVPDRPVLGQNPARFLQMSPRLLQPARLDFTLVSANDDSQTFEMAPRVNPIGGFLLPNHLDAGLLVYDPAGTHLGELRPGIDTDGQQKVIWEAFGNRTFARLEDLVLLYPHLGSFLSGLQSAGPHAFQNFLAAIDETLWTVDPAGERLDPYLPVLIGRPIALVRAQIQLSLEHNPLQDPAWPLTFAPQEPPFPGYAFSVRLGNQHDRQDGLLGFFNTRDYSRFNTVHAPDSSSLLPDDSSYLHVIGPDNFLDLHFNGPSAYLTLLLDPRAGVGAQAGLMPLKRLEVPAELVDPALRALEITFRTGPLLVPKQITLEASESSLQPLEVPALLTPLPAEKNGHWSWLEKNTNQWITTQVKNSDANARLGNEPLTLREGLLKLTGVTASTTSTEKE
ncbi:MAG TPA: hypothetical protein VF458_03705 [Ktedonobacteraceae bacterium]